MPGGSVYEDHTFNKETAHTSHENSTIHGTDFHSTIQVHEYPQYKYMNITKHSRKQKIQNKHLNYKNHLVSAVQGHHRCLFSKRSP
jgi:hypothetical protein